MNKSRYVAIFGIIIIVLLYSSQEYIRHKRDANARGRILNKYLTQRSSSSTTSADVLPSTAESTTTTKQNKKKQKAEKTTRREKDDEHHHGHEHDDPTAAQITSKAKQDDDGSNHHDHHHQASSPASAVKLPRVSSMEELKRHKFFKIRPVPSAHDEKRNSRWLARAIKTDTDVSDELEKIWKIERNQKYDAWTIKGHTRMYMTCELSNRVTVDRSWARGFEQWYVSFVQLPKTTQSSEQEFGVILQSKRNHQYVRLFDRDGGGESLVADIDDITKALRFEVYAADCGKKEVECWGPERKFKANRKESYLAAAAKKNKKDEEFTKPAPFPIFGSPKDLPGDSPLDPHNDYDTYVIAQRTLANWQRLGNMVPTLFTKDPRTVDLINRLNKNATTSSSLSSSPGTLHVQKILVDQTFEIHKKFNQPTYRGLFKRAFELFPDAEAVMYSNSDILFTPSLTETLEHVTRYVREMTRKHGAGGSAKTKGWMLVGQRVNYKVPATWSINDLDSHSEHGDGEHEEATKHSSSSSSSLRAAQSQKWIEDIETRFAIKGSLFQSDAEDYFVVSRNMFDWANDIPDFVVGGVAFDNWITSKGCKRGVDGDAIVVDGSKTITAVHQNHGTNIKGSHQQPKSLYNSRLAMAHGGWSMGHTADAPFATERLVDGRLTVYDKHRLLYD